MSSASILPPPTGQVPGEFWTRLAAEFAGRSDEWRSLAITWSAYHGYEFIDLLSHREVDSGLVEEFKLLAAKTRAYLPQDGVREPWVTLLDAVRASDRTIKDTGPYEFSIPAKRVRAERRALEFRRKEGADPRAVKFAAYRSIVSVAYPLGLALACWRLGFLELTMWFSGVLRGHAESFEKGDKRIAGVPTVRIGEVEPPSHQLGRVLERVCLQLANEAPRKRKRLKSTAKPAPRQGYKREIDEWMVRKGIGTLDEAARRLGVGKDILKSIRSIKGKVRHGEETLKAVLKKSASQTLPPNQSSDLQLTFYSPPHPTQVTDNNAITAHLKTHFFAHPLTV